MPTIPGRARHWLGFALAGLLCLVLAPTISIAQDVAAPQPGAPATIAGTGGGAVLLRAEPGFDAAVLTPLAEGTPVDVVAGPFVAADGTSWTQVAAVGQVGFVPAGALVGQTAPVAPAAEPPLAADPAVPAPGPDAAAPVAGPIAVAAVGETATTTTDLNLRAGPDPAAAVLLVMPPGAAATVTGDPANGYLPVSYNGTAGWAAVAFLSVGGTPPAPAPAPVPTPDPSTGPATTTTDVNLRAGPSTADPILLVVPAGATVAPTGQGVNGFAAVAYNGQAGWVFAAYLSFGGAPAPVPPPTPAPAPSPGVGTATVTSPLNLRTGPSTADAILLIMPAGAQVTITGTTVGDFLPVAYNGTAGWAAAAYLAGDGSPPAPTPAPGPMPSPPPNPGGDTATTTDALNLRAGPSSDAAVLAVMPAGTPVQTTGAAQDGYYPIVAYGQTGWASAAYLSFGGDPGGEPGELPGGGTGIAWPFGGGTWTVIQGYNGGTHNFRGSFADYQYSLDWARTDGNTAGQSVLAPVSGTIRWVDPGSGGMLIDAGNGYGVAFFHVTVAGGLGSGQRVERGQYVGTISGPGGAGYASTPHIDLTLWRLTPEANVSTPFTGSNAISGREFPDLGGSNQHYGTEVSL